MNHISLAAGNKSRFSTVVTGLLAILLVICVVYDPSEAFKASGQGLTIWWRVVFPALLPFVVLSQMLMAGGFAHGLGFLLEPFTRKLLGLPGSFGWILPLGMTAGFPAAAETAATLYKQGRVSAHEAERMAGASHYCSPMLIVVVIGAGFFGQPELGLLLLGIHWIAGIAAGFTLHVFTPSHTTKEQAGATALSGSNHSRLRVAIRHMERARQEDGRSFGKLLGDSVTSGVQTLMIIGGYMLIFAVIIHVILQALPGQVLPVVVKNLLEVHLGTYAMSQTSSLAIPPVILAAMLSASLGWSGLCAYLQVRAVLGPAGIRERYFLVNRLLHGAYAYIITLLSWKPLSTWLPGSLPAYAENKGYALWSDTPTAWLPNWRLAIGVMEWQFWMLGLLTLGILAIAYVWRRSSEH